MSALLCLCLLLSATTPFSKLRSPYEEPTGVLDKSYKRPVTLQGTIADVFPDDVDDAFAFFSVSCTDGIHYVSYMYKKDNSTLNALTHFIGCDVSITGTATKVLYRCNRRVLGEITSIATTNSITVVKRPAIRPFDAPSLIDSPPTLQELTSCGLRKLAGTVVANWGGDSCLIRDQTGEATVVRLRNLPPPTIDETVEIIGQVTTDLYRYKLVQAQWRHSDLNLTCTNAIPPRAIPISWLFTNQGPTRRMINTVDHGNILTINGRLKRISREDDGTCKLILSDGTFEVVVRCNPIDETICRLQPECQLSVTGVCIMESDNYIPNLGFPRVSGLFIVPRATNDIIVIEEPPWWTPKRFMLALAILLVLLAAILLWNVSLHALVVRKSRALLREQEKKLVETLKIEERTRLAAELHDYIAQNLTAVSYQMSAAKSALSLASDKTGVFLDTADKMLQSCRTDLRRCLWDLRSDALNETDLDKAILKAAGPVADDAKVTVRFNVRRSRLQDSTAHTILSVIRELVSNAVHHGHAKSIQVAGEHRDGIIRFSVRDNGQGFNPKQRPGQLQGHFGLDGVIERIKKLNGKLTIDSTPGKGTRVVITLEPKENA